MTFDPAILAAWRAFDRIAGVDEAGRGPLAGPVVAAAVVLPADFEAGGITDSKALRPQVRRALAARILAEAEVGIAVMPAVEIDRHNIHHASLLAMRRAIRALPTPPGAVLVDGKFLPPGLVNPAGRALPGQAIVRGDSRILAIAAASIVAKVTRDRIMEAAEAHFPGYGFAKSAGYPTLAHKRALLALGLTPLHRLSYAPCRALIGGR